MSIIRNLFWMTFLHLAVFLVSAQAADAPELTACGIVTGADAQKFVGGPLEIKESAKVPTAEGDSSYTSTCSYLAKGGNFQEMLLAARGLDITLHFLDTADASVK